jgi:hypothetical protein
MLDGGRKTEDGGRRREDDLAIIHRQRASRPPSGRRLPPTVYRLPSSVFRLPSAEERPCQN